MIYGKYEKDGFKTMMSLLKTVLLGVHRFGVGLYHDFLLYAVMNYQNLVLWCCHCSCKFSMVIYIYTHKKTDFKILLVWGFCMLPPLITLLPFPNDRGVLATHSCPQSADEPLLHLKVTGTLSYVYFVCILGGQFWTSLCVSLQFLFLFILVPWVNLKWLSVAPAILATTVE